MTYKAGLRDRTVAAVCNWLLNNFASKEYRAFILVATKEGLNVMVNRDWEERTGPRDYPPAPPGKGWFRVDRSDAGYGGPGWMRATMSGNDYREDAKREQ